MFASSLETRGRRRGIVLVLVLGMLGLLALIGVTFATFAGQSLINGRNFNQGVARPQPEALMDFALGQLINDTNNPLSALRGHSLLRDMYGNDSLFRGANPAANPAAETGGLLRSVYVGNTLSDLRFTGYGPLHSTGSPTPFFNQLQYTTNIPTLGQYYGLDFTRWIVRFSSTGYNATTNVFDVPQSFEVLEDDATGSVHVFTLSNNLANPTNDATYGISPPPLSASDWTAFIYADPNLGATATTTAGTTSYGKNYSQLDRELNLNIGSGNEGTLKAPSNPFVLDGRYMRAFNGAGLTRFQSGTTYPFNLAAFANFRLNGLDPDAIGMDEDYDACDLENWFLAIQSADGQVMIPSFHRPSLLSATDWTSNPTSGNSKILRPRQADNSPLFPVDPSTLDNNGKLTYDVDNDGDGVTDSVWLDLGYPVQRDPNGKLYKPLFAFMVLGLNGRLPLNTVGNLQARAIGDQTHTTELTYASTGQIPYPGFYPLDTTGAPDFHPLYSSETYLDAPLWDHASHRGFSVNEINPKFALQNAPSNVYPTPGYLSGRTNATGENYQQYDNASVSVALTQMRNLLAGTVPTDIPNGFSFATKASSNYDSDIIIVDGKIQVLPNNVADAFDGSGSTTPVTIGRGLPAVPGRWGEPQGVPKLLDAAGTFVFSGLKHPMLWYNNPVRAGNSVFQGGGQYMTTNVLGTNEVVDDDGDSFDPFLASATQVGTGSPQDFTVVQDIAAVQAVSSAQQPYTLPLNLPVATPHGFGGGNYPTGRSLPEFVDSIDAAGQFSVASERIRRYTTPIDPAGVGRMMNFGTRPGNDHDYGKGADGLGRTGYFRHFRPAGMPQEIRYPYPFANATYPYGAYTPNGGTSHQYLMPVLFPAGYGLATPGSRPDTHTNRYHGYQSMLTPQVTTTTPALTPPLIASMGAMPFDWDPTAITNQGDVPGGYASGVGGRIALISPTINPFATSGQPMTLYNSNSLLTSVNSSNGPNLGSLGNPTGGTYPIPYASYGSTNNEPYSDTTTSIPGAQVVNGYLGGSLNKDEADEMNLYTASRSDMPYGASDLEWLYRKQDVDGATLTSRLSKLAPISFLNPADGQTRRRMFSTDVWDLNTFSYANDNPLPYAGVAYSGDIGGTTYSFGIDHDFTYNSRFAPNASPSLENMNQVPATAATNASNPADPFYQFANFITTEFLPNPTFPPQGADSTFANPTIAQYGNTITDLIPNSSYLSGGIGMPKLVDHTAPLALFAANAITNAVANTNLPAPLIIPTAGGQSGGTPVVPLSMVQAQTPSVAHRDRKINLNYPLPIANDPAEPVRQKWCRETYQLFKAILPPASVDTPEELAALSQFVVNIIDFRDTDCTATRFVNTDLVVTDVLTRSALTKPVGTLDLTWTVTPSGVKFADQAIPNGNFPYDPSIYSPDTVTPFLVQHGMEYSPIALNEVLAYQGIGSSGNYQAFFLELVNTLTADQNGNASDVSIGGWDIVVTPDASGWGRPDSITGDVNPIAFPPLVPNPSGNLNLPPITNGPNSQRPYTAGTTSSSFKPPTTDLNLMAIQAAVQQYSFLGGGQSTNRVPAMTGSTPSYFVIGDYQTGNPTSPMPILDANIASYENPPVVASFAKLTTPPPTGSPPKPAKPLGARLSDPTTSFISLPTPPSGSAARYYWVYLRRPANPFDDQQANQVRPNKEMVVVDSMRFAVVDGSVGGNQAYSAQRLQPYRGGHLVPYATPPTLGPPTGTGTALPPKPGPSPAAGYTTICPPSPAAAYGYSEQIVPATTGTAKMVGGTKSSIFGTITAVNSTVDANTSTPTIHDRDFTSVPELLLVPGCPPGLFTKQFIEEPYPGNIFKTTPINASTPTTTTATGLDDGSFATGVTVPNATTDPSVQGRKDFNFITLPAAPTFPYLPDNFYYTAASVAPPNSGTLDPGYKHLTTEVGGWTGAGWHKMLEFVEVPSSANGAVGTADNGNNYDWYRADLKPGQVNINLIIDEEVFAGVIDDPRMNEALAAASSTIPFVVSQIDGFGYPSSDTSGNIHGRSPIFNQPSTNIAASGNVINSPPFVPNPNFGRGYVYRDPNAANYLPSSLPSNPAYQQVHGIKAAFSDFLKLRHGGSGYLFGFGAGPTGSGDFVLGPLTLVSGAPQTQPLAADRPFRSLSYPDINYTILRPASLPPSLTDPNKSFATDPNLNQVIFPGTNPSLPPAFAPLKAQGGNPATFGMFQYQADPTTPNPPFPYVQLTPALAPMHKTPPGGKLDTTTDFQYIQDPGIKNPYLPIQYVNQTSPNNLPAAAPGASSTRLLGPPYATQDSPTLQPPAAPFPPPIPPIPARRLLQVPDWTNGTANPPTYPLTAPSTSNASLYGQIDNGVNKQYMVNQPTITPMLSTLPAHGSAAPPSLVDETRAVFLADNYVPQPIGTANNFLGAGPGLTAVTDDYRQHPNFRTEWLQKISNLTTVRTHQFATWITVGFFEVVKVGTPELGIPDTLGQELGVAKGNSVRYRSFFVLDRTKATGFNPYYPGNFRDCVTYRRRIE